MIDDDYANAADEEDENWCDVTTDKPFLNEFFLHFRIYFCV